MALSNILLLITVALRHKVIQSPNALTHLISFMSWRIWISQVTRVKQKVISASFLHLNLVESKLNCESKSWLPIGILLRALNCLVPWRIHRQNFLLTDKNLWIQTISRGKNWREVWIRHCRRFPHCQHEHFSRSRPLQCFYVFSRLTSCYRLLPGSYRRLHSTTLML